jgi:molybdopterin molybdotransferase
MTDADSPQRIAKLTPLADVLARIDALVKPVEPRAVEIAGAIGRVPAGDANGILEPRVPLALRDGWAVSADLTSDASSYAPVPLPATARIDVGQPLPAGADAVAPLDAMVPRDGRTDIIAPVGVGEGVLPAGADANRQTTWVRQGRRITRTQAAVLAAARVERLHVCEPAVRLVGSRAASDAVIDAAIDLIAGEITAAGGRVLPPQQASPGDVPPAHALSDQAADAIIAVGGTGAGRNDASVVALARVGEVVAHGIAVSPGETAAFGRVGPRPVLLLPGRLDAALAVWLVVGRRLLARLTGCSDEEAVIRARLARKVTSTLGLAEVVPVRIHEGAVEPIASGYVPLSALARANGWIFIKPDSEGYPAGSEVVVRPWP